MGLVHLDAPKVEILRQTGRGASHSSVLISSRSKSSSFIIKKDTDVAGMCQSEVRSARKDINLYGSNVCVYA